MGLGLATAVAIIRALAYREASRIIASPGICALHESAFDAVDGSSTGT